jgi:FtsP/CotA-like multicopper oxidase with cupredoxin domain
MNKPKWFILITLLMIIAALPWGVNLAQAGPGTLAGADASATPSGGTFYANSPAGTNQYCNAAGVCNPTTSPSGPPLAKFVDRLPGLGLAGCTVSGTPGTGTCNENNLGQYIPIASPEKKIYSGIESDYYEIGLKDYTQKMHTNLPKATKLRGYYQINGTDHSSQYLGPAILAKTYDPTKTAGVAGNGWPVRIKFFNQLGIDGAGDLFIPVDPTFMGAGLGPKKANGDVCNPVTAACASYTQNRATIHLHGGATPWISDGTPHQWITPSGDLTPYKKGMSQKNVPDMPDPNSTTQGEATFYYTNQQSGRLMFYHDHAYGLTRLNVYAGEAAGYLLYDQTEEDLILGTNVSGIFTTLGRPAASTIPNNGGDVYTYGIPLVIQDKTFVPADIAVQDAKWTNAKWGVSGDLWFPHIYETNQWPGNPDLSGANNFGRWDYGPWFWPPVVVDAAHSTPPAYQWDLSATPEAFMDTMVVNGTAYPYLPVNPKAYRFRILNASNDRPLNLQLYVVDPTITSGPGVDKEVKMVDAAPRLACNGTSIITNCICSTASSPPGCFPTTWPTDGRIGGVPDPAYAGPKMIQIGTEGGLLPAPVVLDNQPVGYEYNRRTIVVLDILNQTLLLGPAERADVIIDFSAFRNKKIILYNDAPSPNPAFDPRYDYFTGAPDNTWMGGAPTTQPGVGPNTRTIMQFQVADVAPENVTPLYDDPAYVGPAGTLTTAINAAFNATQPKPIVPQTTYPAPNNVVIGAQYAHIQDNSLSFTPIGASAQTTINFKSKAIQELWDPYGRMNATLGVELPFTNNNIQTTIPLGYVDPVTEVIYNNQTQLWKITHNGVDTHPVHVHLFNVQLINRVGWDGAIRPPEPNELGWKETVRMKPLEDVIVAFKPVLPTLPFTIPNSIRPLDVTQPVNATLTLTNPVDGNAISVVNAMTNFGHEYVWHCHILGHEENDFMRPVVLNADQLLYVANTADGIWQWDMGTWSKILATDPTSMVASGSLLYADFGGALGLQKWNGSSWSKLMSTSPLKMVASDSLLYADFGGALGLQKWNGSSWSKLMSTSPLKMVASGSLLYADFGGALGLQKWNGSSWSKLAPTSPTSMVASGSLLYADFTGTWRLQKLEGSSWSLLSATDPFLMVAGF